VVSLGIFSVVPPTEPCALRSIQPLKVSTKDFSWGKGSQCVWLMTYHPCSAETSRKSGALTYPEPLGPPRPVAGHLYFHCTQLKKSVKLQNRNRDHPTLQQSMSYSNNLYPIKAYNEYTYYTFNYLFHRITTRLQYRHGMRNH